MDLFAVQEFLAVLLAVAAMTGTMLVLGIGFILFREGIRRAVHGRRTQVVSVTGVKQKTNGSKPRVATIDLSRKLI
jgi:hypothetical protein